MKLFKEYNKVKDVFIKPKINYYFGKWTKDPCLPVWRRGPVLRIGKHKNTYTTKDQVMIKTGKSEYTTSDGKVQSINCYNWAAKHKLPKNVGAFNWAWIRPLRKKLKSIGLGWLAPSYVLPIWLAFHIFDLDLMWKTKWTPDDIRFEFPPSFTIVLFGFSFSMWLSSPEPKGIIGEGYWSGILGYIYSNRTGNKMYNAVCTAGRWQSKDKCEFALLEDHIKPAYKEQYRKAVELYMQKVRCYEQETSEGF